MKILSLDNNVINIQKCLLPDVEYLNKNFGRYCVVSVPGMRFGILVKIGLCHPKQMSGAFFMDSSVLIFQTSERTRRPVKLKDVNFQNFQLLPHVLNAKIINVILVFNEVTDMTKLKTQRDRLIRITREILKLYTFSKNSVIFLDNLSSGQRNGIYCIDISGVNGECSVKDFNIYRCTGETEIVINERLSRNKYETYQSCTDEIKLGGLSQNYRILKEIIEFSKNYKNVAHNFKLSNKILLIGPPGCGKTSLVHNVTRNCKTVLIEVLLPELCSSLPGETEKNLQNVFDKAKLHSDNGENCVILIEDIDMLCVKQKDDTSANIKRSANKLISLLESFDNVKGLVIIATTTHIDDTDPQLRRAKRFDDELEIMVPSEEDRREIISNLLDYFKVKCSNEVIQNFALWTPGFVGADLHLAIQETLLAYYKLKGSFEELNYNTLEICFKKVLSNITPTALKASAGLQMQRDSDFSKIGGLHDIKKLLNFSVKQQLLNPEIFTRMGIPLTKGILLYGPPGCAKTTLVKALAKETNMTFLAVSSADLYSPFVGDPERQIIQLFSQARIGAPAIIFIDEIDGLFGSKSGDRIQGVQERVLSTLLVEMDGIGVRVATQRDSSLKLLGNSGPEKQVKTCENNDRNAVIVIGATNRPERLDDALKRPGRFDKIIYVPPPDETERLHILKTLTEKMPLDDTVDLNLIANVTAYYSGADLKNLCQESALLALTESQMTATCVHQSHFQKVLTNSRPSLNPDMIGFYESFQKNIV